MRVVFSKTQFFTNQTIFCGKIVFLIFFKQKTCIFLLKTNFWLVFELKLEKHKWLGNSQSSAVTTTIIIFMSSKQEKEKSFCKHVYIWSERMLNVWCICFPFFILGRKNGLNSQFNKWKRWETTKIDWQKTKQFWRLKIAFLFWI